MAGKLAFADRYLDRLDRSLAELKIARPMSRAALLHVMSGGDPAQRCPQGTVYIQVTRGVAPRDHKFPKGIKPLAGPDGEAWKAPSPDLLAKGAADRHRAGPALGAPRYQMHQPDRQRAGQAGKRRSRAPTKRG